jgi:hypothetical protein
VEKNGLKMSQIHAHHIVMKKIPKKWILTPKGRAARDALKESHAILERNGVSVLKTIEDAEKAGEKGLHNMSWAVNGYQGIHSYEYAHAVRKELVDAVKAAKLAGRSEKDAVIAALKRMGDTLEEGKKFW